MDILSEILSIARVEGSVFSRAELRAPWAVSTRGSDRAIFHVLLEGSCEIAVEGGPVQALRPGDLVVLPHGHAHVLRDPAGAPARPIRDLPGIIGADGLLCIRHGGGGARTHIVCGTFALAEEGRELLLSVLPVLLHHAPGQTNLGAWVDSTLNLLAEELSAGRPGAALVAGRLADLLFIQALRAWSAHPDSTGWLRALADPQLGRALHLIHGEPATAWTIERLATKVAMSRTAFFERFGAVMGESPAAYLTRWRMQLARRHLRAEAGIAAVAEAVGYSSEAAFSRAFKRHTGQSPSAWRRAAAR